MTLATRINAPSIGRDESPETYRFTVSDVLKMDKAGIFDPEVRIELIEGEIVVMPPIGPGHAGDVNRLTYRLPRLLGDQVLVIGQNPLRLSDLSLPQPDISVLRLRDDF